jgi:peptidyl-prolyl cis-trans isomerase B (cyclophilin B)
MVVIEMADGGIIKIELDKKAARSPAKILSFWPAPASSTAHFPPRYQRFYDSGRRSLRRGSDEGRHGRLRDQRKRRICGQWLENPISHVRGVVSMARSQDPDSASSQFFIVHEDSTFLDGQYAAFGRVVEGMDVVDTIANSAVRNERPVYAKKMKKVYLTDE